MALKALKRYCRGLCFCHHSHAVPDAALSELFAPQHFHLIAFLCCIAIRVAVSFREVINCSNVFVLGTGQFPFVAIFGVSGCAVCPKIYHGRTLPDRQVRGNLNCRLAAHCLESAYLSVCVSV